MVDEAHDYQEQDRKHYLSAQTRFFGILTLLETNVIAQHTAHVHIEVLTRHLHHVLHPLTVLLLEFGLGI